MKHNSKFAKMVISMVWLLAFSIMLIGTTFAWFTDTVTNTGNRIQAGTLSVQLLKHDGSAYQEISNGEGDIFESSIKWEPGYTKIVWLAVKNDGNLPLKYTVKLDVAEGETSLIGALTYGFVVGAEYSADNEKLGSWAEIRGDSRTQGKSDVTAGIMTLASEVELAAEATDYFALVVHMEESATDIYQGASIDIDMKIVAKQTSEDAEGPVDWERKMPDGILTFEVGEPSTAVKEGSPIPIWEMTSTVDTDTGAQMWEGMKSWYEKESDIAFNHFVHGQGTDFNEMIAIDDGYIYSSWVVDGEIYMIVLNVKGEEVTLEINLTSDVGNVSVGAYSAAVINGSAQTDFTGNNTVSVTLEKDQVVLYKITPIDTIDFSFLG